MEDIKVGEYVRTPYHQIEKVIKITKEKDFSFVETENNAYGLEWFKRNITKRSFNLIDLLEVRRYIRI